MKKISEHNIPLSPDHFQHDIWLLTDKVFAEKDLDETIAHGLSQYVHTYYDFLVKNKKVDTAHIFLATYTKVLHEIEKIKNKDELQKIAKVLENWLDGVEKIYEDSKDM